MRHRHAPIASLLAAFTSVAAAQAPAPHVVLVMADDQGWGDAGYLGHPHLRTPHLDRLAAEGVRFERFYAAAPVCSPTRGSVLTGRHPTRLGIPGANSGHLPEEESCLAEVLAARGYATGFFGKWHLGTLTRDVVDSNRGGRAEHQAQFSPPARHGFQSVFATEAKVPTYDPMVHPNTGKPYGTRYWNEQGQVVTENLAGDDSRVIMDRVLPFIDASLEAEKPFFTVVWFHAPHLPVGASIEDQQRYADHPEFLRRYWGTLTALDSQLGRLRAHLEERGVARDTLLVYCADNGPEGKTEGARGGSTGGLRGRKRDLLEGGVRVPGLLSWPAAFEEPRSVTAPAVTSDLYPTVLAAVGHELPDDHRPLDGIDLLPLIRGERETRGSAIGFRAGKKVAWTTDRWKLVGTRQGPVELFDLQADPAEANDLSEEHPEIRRRLAEELEAWLRGL